MSFPHCIFTLLYLITYFLHANRANIVASLKVGLPITIIYFLHTNRANIVAYSVQTHKYSFNLIRYWKFCRLITFDAYRFVYPLFFILLRYSAYCTLYIYTLWCLIFKISLSLHLNIAISAPACTHWSHKENSSHSLHSEDLNVCILEAVLM